MSADYSDEHLNAYLDNQLDAEERSQLLQALRTDRKLAERICKLQKVQDMLQLAYHNVSLHSQYAAKNYRMRHSLAQTAAALLILGVGVSIGWMSNPILNRQPGLIELAQSSQLVPHSVVNDKWKLILHVNSDEPARLHAVLDETEHLLKNSLRKGRKISIEVLANGAGLNLLKEDSNPYIQKVRYLNSQYENLRFVACRVAMERYKNKNGTRLNLIAGTKVVPSALHQALLRQRDGWTYLRI